MNSRATCRISFPSAPIKLQTDHATAYMHVSHRRPRAFGEEPMKGLRYKVIRYQISAMTLRPRHECRFASQIGDQKSMSTHACSRTCKQRNDLASCMHVFDVDAAVALRPRPRLMPVPRACQHRIMFLICRANARWPISRMHVISNVVVGRLLGSLFILVAVERTSRPHVHLSKMNTRLLLMHRSACRAIARCMQSSDVCWANEGDACVSRAIARLMLFHGRACMCYNGLLFRFFMCYPARATPTDTVQAGQRPARDAPARHVFDDRATNPRRRHAAPG